MVCREHKLNLRGVKNKIYISVFDTLRLPQGTAVRRTVEWDVWHIVCLHAELMDIRQFVSADVSLCFRNQVEFRL